MTTCNKCPMEVWYVEAWQAVENLRLYCEVDLDFYDVAISPDDKRFAAIPAVYMAEDLNAFGGFIGFWILGAEVGRNIHYVYWIARAFFGGARCRRLSLEQARYSARRPVYCRRSGGTYSCPSAYDFAGGVGGPAAFSNS